MNIGQRAMIVFTASPGVVSDEMFLALGFKRIQDVVAHHSLPVERVRGLGYRAVRAVVG